MKKTILFAILSFCLPAMLQAQVTGAAQAVLPIKFDLGIKAGANFTKLSGDSWESGYKTGVLGGIFAGVHRNRFGVQVEALFSQSQYVTNGTSFLNSASIAAGTVLNNAADSAKHGGFSVGYLNIPVLLNVKLFGNAWFQVGPQYSGVVSVNDKDNLVKDAEGLFKSGDISGVFGLWVNLPVKLNVGARYIVGFSDMKDNGGLSGSWKNRGVQIHLGYSFL